MPMVSDYRPRQCKEDHRQLCGDASTARDHGQICMTLRVISALRGQRGSDGVRGRLLRDQQVRTSLRPGAIIETASDQEPRR